MAYQNVLESPSTKVLCSMYSAIYSPHFLSSENVVTFKTIFRPYYKLLIEFKAIPNYLTYDSSTIISYHVLMKDNLTNEYRV